MWATQHQHQVLVLGPQALLGVHWKAVGPPVSFPISPLLPLDWKPEAPQA